MNPPDEQHRKHLALIDAAWQQVEHVRSTTGGGSRRPVRDRWPGDAPADLLPGYRITREITRGGQGIVFEGVQESTRRTVAIKVMRDGPLAGARERTRFEREVQILAQMRHPNIVTVHDSGVAGHAAYFVMDYIDGAPLDQYVQQHTLSLRERLGLLARVCAAVNVAHLRGVIHRDLKPSNIRVDATGEPHILDFGLARYSTNQPVAPEEADRMTLTGQFVGSLPWASPEQVRGQGDDIDVRTDVYSLGVMLYQVLTGSLPYEVSSVLHETARTILEVEPRNPRSLNRQLDEELATIVLKALRKERDLRYQSAGELGRDLERYLSGQPIEAKRDSISYVFRKHLARHKLKAGVAAAFVLLIAVGLVVSLTFWRQAAVARDAEARQKRLARSLAHEAEAEAARAWAVTAFLQDMLSAADPTRGQRPDVTVREALEAAAAQIESGALAAQPLVEAGTRAAIGRTYLRLGLYEQAAEHLEAALALDRAHRGPTSREVAIDQSNLGMLARAVGDLERAAEHYRDALDILEALDLEHGREMSDLLNNLALLLHRKGEYAAAVPVFERALAVDRSLADEPGVEEATTLNNYALLLRDQGETERAAALFRQTLSILRNAYGNDHIHVAAVLESLGSIHLEREEFGLAEPLYREALDIRRRLLGPEHPHVASGFNNLGYLLYTKGDYDGAEPLYREALALRRKILGADHPKVATVLNNLGLLLTKRGAHGEAEPLYREALEIKRARLGDTHPSTLLQLSNLGALLRKQGKLDAAATLGAEAVSQAATRLPSDHLHLAIFRAEWGASLADQERYQEAEPPLRRAGEVLRKRLGPTHRRTRGVAERLVAVYEALGRQAEADRWRPEQSADPGREAAVDPSK